MELNQLYSFLVLCEYKNMSRAAEEALFVSQPALSKSIKRLEEELGTELFKRTKYGIELTSDGELTYKYIKKVFEELDELKNALDKNNAETDKTLIVASPEMVALRYLLPPFNDANPLIHTQPLYMQQDKLEKALLNKTVDIAISVEQIKNDRIFCLPFLEHRPVVSMLKTDEYAARNSIELKDLDNKTFVSNGNSKHSPLFQKLLRQLEKENIKIKNIEIKDEFLRDNQLKNTDYYAFAANLATAYLRKNPERVYIPIADKSISETYYITKLKKSSYSAEVFTAWIRSNYRQIANRE